MIAALAARALLRHRARTVLALVGIAISSAMLVDMVMMASGMRHSFKELLEGQGFQLRLAPRGTLPFDGEATIGAADSLLAALARIPEVVAIAPVLGGTVHAPMGDRAVSAFGLGISPEQQGDYRLVICPDHPTFLRTKTHSHGDVPFALCGRGVTADESTTYDEVIAAASPIRLDRGCELMPLLFRET